MTSDSESTPYQTLTQYDDLQTLIAQSHKLVIMCSAPWCGPCKQIRPLFANKATDHKDIVFAYINISDFADPDEKFITYVRGLPTFFSYYDGLLQNTFTGANATLLNAMIGALSNK